MPEWRPIDSTEHPAPRDGTEVIIAGHYGGDPDAPQFVEISRWVNGDWYGYQRQFYLVTHWQPKPLPPPPKDEG